MDSHDRREVLVVPGFTGSGPGHWQSIWEGMRPEYRRVEQQSWDDPQPGEWIASLDRAVEEASGPTVLVAHSLGATLVVAWAATGSADRVEGAFLVSPPDVECDDAPEECRRFAPIPLRLLPFPSLLIASTDDPLLEPPRAREFAEAWGSEIRWATAAGHINTASGHGPWPEGLAHLDRFLGDLA